MATCKYCGKSIDATEAFKVDVPTKSKTLKSRRVFYCSKAEYQKQINKESYRDSINKTLKYLIGDGISYAVFNKEISNLYTLNDGKTLNDYLIENKTYLDSVLQSKSFSNLYFKSKYLISIIKNNICKYKSTETQSVDIELVSVITDMDTLNINKFKDTKKRRSLADIEDNLL